MSQNGVFIIALMLISSIMASTDQSDSGSAEHGAQGHGIRVASWRIDEYRKFLGFLVLVLFAALLKIAFHHVPKLTEWIPESCVLIIFGLITGSKE